MTKDWKSVKKRLRIGSGVRKEIIETAKRIERENEKACDVRNEPCGRAGSNPALLIFGILSFGVLLAVVLALLAYAVVPGPVGPSTPATPVYVFPVIEKTVVGETKVVKETVEASKFADCVKVRGLGSSSYVLECESQ